MFVGLVAASRVVLTPPRILVAGAALIAVQVLMLVAAGELGVHGGLAIPIAAVRACAIVTPVALFGMTFRLVRPHELKTPGGVQPTTV
jgi:hypothetical protein